MLFFYILAFSPVTRKQVFFPLFGWSAKTSNCSPCLRTPIWASTICEKAIKAKHVHILDLCNYTSRNTSTGSCWCQWLVQSEEFKACLQCRTDTLNGLDVSVFCRFITHQMSTKATQGGRLGKSACSHIPRLMCNACSQNTSTVWKCNGSTIALCVPLTLGNPHWRAAVLNCIQISQWMYLKKQ